MGNVEQFYKPGGEIESKRYPSGELIISRTELNGSVSYDTQILLGDHLGSTHLLIDTAGSIVQGMSFDPFGKRRSDTNLDWAGLSVPIHKLKEIRTATHPARAEQYHTE